MNRQDARHRTGLRLAHCHKTESVYRRYAIVAEADLAEGVARLAALHAHEGATAGVVVLLVGRTSTVRAQFGAARG